jgi:hypothetical protein
MPSSKEKKGGQSHVFLPDRGNPEDRYFTVLAIGLAAS